MLSPSERYVIDLRWTLLTALLLSVTEEEHEREGKVNKTIVAV
jgi:hypothetical protein